MNAMPSKPAASAACARSTMASCVMRICGRKRWKEGAMVSVGAGIPRSDSEASAAPARSVHSGAVTTDYETVTVRKDDGVAWVTLARPEVRNAINERMQAELREIWTGFRYDDEVRCVVLTGEGESFCTGIDRAEAVS